MAKDLQPLFVAVTWGAGGSTALRSIELAELCQRKLHLTTCLHLTCTNMRRQMVDDALTEARGLGIRNILALRGDPARDDALGIPIEEESFAHAVDLVRHIRKQYDDYFCVGVAAYPEGHADESHPVDQNPLNDIPALIEKTQAGADFIMTQLFYDPEAYLKFEDLLRNHTSGIFTTIPIIPGLMPVQNYGILKRTTYLSHCRLPKDLLELVDAVRGDDEAVKREGADYLSLMIQKIRQRPSPGPRGFHFFTMNLESVVSTIVQRCLLHTPIHTGRRQSVTAQLTTDSHRKLSNAAPIDLQGREATWDDFPNGRFGDARSPAFNAPLTYNATSLLVSPLEAARLWGAPRSKGDITAIFLAHLTQHKPSRLPWSDTESLSPETALIKEELTHLIEHKHFWTIASQPGVSGLSSDDPIHGWGPAKGFVFQKAFVEFFMSGDEFHQIIKPRMDHLGQLGQIAYYAAAADTTFYSSETATAVNPVTWGSFSGKEIATASMVEELSFRAWASEAFEIWASWAQSMGDVARQYLPGTPERRRLEESRDFLENVMGQIVLVNIIGHDFQNPRGFWSLF